MDHETLERCWQSSGDFNEFEELLECRTGAKLDHAAWREAAGFLYNKSRAPAGEASEATILDVPKSMTDAPRYESLHPGSLHSPASRPKFTRGTVEGEMIHAMSPGSTPNRTGSVLSPLEALDTTTSTPPTSLRAPERRPFSPVIPPPMHGDRQLLLESSEPKSGNICTPSFISESSDQPESRQLRAEAFPTRQFLNNSWNAGDSKENFLAEGEKPRLMSPCGSITVKPIQEGGLKRYNSKVRLLSVGGQALSAVPAGVSALIPPQEDRSSTSFRGVSPPPKGAAAATTGGAMPSRPATGAGSTPAPLRNTTSPRQASPLQMIKYRSSQPPPQSAAQVWSATLTPTASGSLGVRTSTSFGGSQCAGSFGATLGGGTGQYQSTHVSHPLLVRQSQDVRRVVSPRF